MALLLNNIEIVGDVHWYWYTFITKARIVGDVEVSKTTLPGFSTSLRVVGGRYLVPHEGLAGSRGELSRTIHHIIGTAYLNHHILTF